MTEIAIAYLAIDGQVLQFYFPRSQLACVRNPLEQRYKHQLGKPTKVEMCWSELWKWRRVVVDASYLLHSMFASPPQNDDDCNDDHNNQDGN
jgi:hypothetical protein